jgi:hypothetical protein
MSLPFETRPHPMTGDVTRLAAAMRAHIDG